MKEKLNGISEREWRFLKYNMKKGSKNQYLQEWKINQNTYWIKDILKIRTSKWKDNSPQHQQKDKVYL